MRVNTRYRNSTLRTFEDIPWVEFLYLVFTRMPREICRRRFGYWLCPCDVFPALFNSLYLLIQENENKNVGMSDMGGELVKRTPGTGVKPPSRPFKRQWKLERWSAWHWWRIGGENTWHWGKTSK